MKRTIMFFLICITTCLIGALMLRIGKNRSRSEKWKYLDVCNFIFFVVEFIFAFNDICMISWVLYVAFAIVNFFEVVDHRLIKNKSQILQIGLFLVLSFITVRGLGRTRNMFLPESDDLTISVYFVIFWLQMAILAFCNGDKESKTKQWINDVTMATGLFAIYEYVLAFFINSWSLPTNWQNFITQFTEPVFQFNLLFMILIATFLKGLLGRHLGGFIYSVLYAIFLIGNGVKILYQGSLLTPIDVTVLKEFFLILPNYIGTIGIVASIVALVICVILLVKNIKKVGRYLAPKFNRMVIFVAPLLILFTYGIYTNKFEMYVLADSNWVSEFVQWEYEGSGVYNLYKIAGIKEYFPSKPDGYSLEMVQELKEEVEKEYPYDSEETEQPDVILIMAESLFDVTELEGIEMEEDYLSNVHQYQLGNVVSTRYGGGTAGVEFEGLTGFSNVFFAKDLVAYTTYMNQLDMEVPSIASVMSDNGYTTTAIHMNDSRFYNRDNAYSIMGFDQFISLFDVDVTEEDKNQDGYVQDQFLVEEIEKQLESDDSPQFIFAVTIESHNPYETKYESTDVQIESDSLSDAAMSELKQYVQSVKNFDDALGELIEYCSNREKPTVIYVWGDHLPSLKATDELGSFAEDGLDQYRTPYVVYSNYNTPSVDVAEFTPNQITPQIIYDLGLEHESFYDYIYNLRTTTPIIHSDFMDDETREDLEDYWIIQYDQMFGKDYWGQ